MYIHGLPPSSLGSYSIASSSLHSRTYSVTSGAVCHSKPSTATHQSHITAPVRRWSSRGPSSGSASSTALPWHRGDGLSSVHRSGRQERGLRLRTSAAISNFDNSGSSPARGHLQAAAAKLNAFYQFTRPHTIIGTAISILSVSVLALQGQPWSDSAITALCQALVSALLMNISIVGINQCFDVEIDKINKPYLPLASGEFSMATGIAIVAVTAVLSLLTGAASGSGPLFCTLAGSLVLGIVYSADLPFMRWKRFPYLAAACILAVRAVMVQLGFYHHIKQAVGAAQLELTRPLLFTVGFMLLFSVVIALFKDIPDVKGDTQAGVRTFSVRAGVERVFWVCVGILAAAYAGGIAFGLSSADVCSRVVVAAGHAAFAGLLLWRARQVDLQQTDELVDYYMFIWKLFYAEYLLIPFFR